MYKRQCENCNRTFKALTPWGRYCGNACKMAAYRRRKAQGEKVKQQQPQKSESV